MGRKARGTASVIRNVLEEKEQPIIEAWRRELARSEGAGVLDDETVQRQCEEFLRALTQGLAQADDAALFDHEAAPWEEVRAFLAELTEQRVRQGFTPVETALFVFSLKKPVSNALRSSIEDPHRLADAIDGAYEIVARLGLYTMQVFQEAREKVIRDQEREMLELSTPVVVVWEGILALPLIGTLDSERTQVVMERLLNRIVEHRATIAIIDITGVPTIDTLTAQHLLKTVSAARLMGAECIISGIRPQIAQTMVHLGIELEGITTKATLAGALRLALARRGFTITRN